MKRTRLVAWVLSAIVLSAPLAAMALSPMLIFAGLTGRLQINQNIPCGAVVNITTPVADGRMELTPTPQDRGGRTVLFDLTRLDLFFTPFSVRHECRGVTGSVDFREIGVRLVKGVVFTGEAVGDPQDRRYRFSIPKAQVLIFESVLDNMPVSQPQTQYQRPSEDVTGEIDLRRGTAQLNVALSSRLHFRAGCVGTRCVIDEELKGTQTAEITATIARSRTERR